MTMSCLPLQVQPHHRGNTRSLACQTWAAFSNPREGQSRGLGMSQGPRVAVACFLVACFLCLCILGGSLKVSQPVHGSHGLWLQVAGPVSSSAVTLGTRWSALALWATSCSRMVSPVKVTSESWSPCLGASAGGLSRLVRHNLGPVPGAQPEPACPGCLEFRLLDKAVFQKNIDTSVGKGLHCGSPGFRICHAALRRSFFLSPCLRDGDGAASFAGVL